jgi:outer membrane murein-binding lipoprotein Lpp
MKKLLILPVLFLACGCLSRMNQRMDAMNQKLDELSAKMDQTNGYLASVEKSTTKMAKLVP